MTMVQMPNINGVIPSRGVHGSGLCPTQTRPKFFGWVKNKIETD